MAAHRVRWLRTEHGDCAGNDAALAVQRFLDAGVGLLHRCLRAGLAASETPALESIGGLRIGRSDNSGSGSLEEFGMKLSEEISAQEITGSLANEVTGVYCLEGGLRGFDPIA